jgi:hypothetical protein
MEIKEENEKDFPYNETDPFFKAICNMNTAQFALFLVLNDAKEKGLPVNTKNWKAQ